MQNWFDSYAPGIVKGLPLFFPLEKPPAFVGIDDRVIQFTGSWPALDYLDRFKTWNAKARKRFEHQQIFPTLKRREDRHIFFFLPPTTQTRHPPRGENGIGEEVRHLDWAE